MRDARDEDFELAEWTIVNKVDTIYKEKVPSTAT